MSGLSNLDSFRDGWWVVVQLQFSGVLSPELVKYSLQHSCVVAVKPFFSLHLVSVHEVHPYSSINKTAVFYFIGQVWFPYDRYPIDKVGIPLSHPSYWWNTTSTKIILALNNPWRFIYNQIKKKKQLTRSETPVLCQGDHEKFLYSLFFELREKK